MSVRDYVVLWSGGRTTPGGSVAGGGTVALTTAQHALDGAEHTPASDTAALNASVDAHGLLAKLSGLTTDELRGDGTWGRRAEDAEGAIAVRYIFDTTTTDSDPGSGKLRLSNATQASAITVRCDLADVNAIDVTALLDLIGAQTGSPLGYLRLQKTDDPTKWLVATVSAIASPAGYRNITIANIAKSANSPFANGDALTFVFVPATVGLAVAGALAGYQPLDSDLTAIAALAPTNDDVIQRKAGAWTNRTIAQILVDLATPGTTFQPLDSDLTAFAALAIAADTLPYGTGAHTLALTTLSTFIRTLLDDADAATARGTLGLGALAVLASLAHSATTGQTADDHHAQLHQAAHLAGGADALTLAAPTASAPGDASVTGAAASMANSGHRHAREAWGAVGDVVASAPGDTASAGASGKEGDAAHRHAREAYGALGDITASARADTGLGGAVGKVADAGHRHPREAISTAVPVGDSGTGSAGTSALAANDDHRHPTPVGIVPGSLVFHGAKIGRSTNLTLVNATWTAVPLTSANTFDLDGGHPSTSVAALTGTIDKTGGNAAILGHSTLFTTELVVGQCFDLPGGAGTDRIMVVAITDNTHLTAATAPAGTAAGQTGTRVASTFAVYKASMTGYYGCNGAVQHANTAGGGRYISIGKGTTPVNPSTRGNQPVGPGTVQTNVTVNVFEFYNLQIGDYIECWAYEDNGANQILNSAGLSLGLIGV